MPPPTDKAEDNKPAVRTEPKDNSSDSGANSGGINTMPRDLSDVFHGGGDSGSHEQGALSDPILRMPERGFHWSAKDFVISSNLAEGKATVTNVSFKVTDSDGRTREISGPSSYNGRGQQFVIDSDTHQKYRITPPAEEGGQATLTPFGRRGQHETFTIVDQKSVDGFTRRSTSTPADSGEPVPKVNVRATEIQPQPSVVRPAVIPDVVANTADNNGGWRGPRLLQQSEDRLRQMHVPEETIQSIQQFKQAFQRGEKPSPELFHEVQKGIQEYRAEQFRQAQENWRNNNGDNPNYKMQPPVTKEQFDQIRQQFQQNPQAAMEALRQFQQQNREQQQGKPEQIQAQVRPEQQQQFQQMQLERGRLQMTPEQMAQVLQDRLRQQVIDAKPGQPDVAHKPALDPALRDILADKNNRTALIDLLKDLQHGKLPPDAVVQSNRSLQDVMKALGPDALTDLRRVLSHSDGTAHGGRPIDSKIDLMALSPKAREIVELIAAQSLQRNLPFDQMRLNPATLASERLLDILRQSDRTLLPGQRVPDTDTSRLNMIELGRVLREMNLQQHQDGRPLALRDIISRTFEEGRERSTVQNLAIRELAIRPVGQEEAVRLLLDRLHHREQDARTEFTVRTELLTNRIESRPQDFRLDMTKMEVKPDRADPTIKVENRQDALLTGKQERVLDSDQLAQTHKDLQGKQAAAQTEKTDKKKDDDELPVDQAVVLAALTAKKRKEQEEKDKQENSQEKDKKEPERRQKYIVRPGDTLELIAARMLRDKRLAGLIYDINKEIIPVAVLEGKKVPQLRERMVIWLPTPTEAKDYRTRLMSSPVAKTEYASAEDELAARFGKNWDGAASAASGTAGGAALEDMEDAARVAYAARRKHIESLLGPLSSKSESSQPKHVVRLGETLKSVAMKHPALQDVALWKLLAELNGLSTQTDERGTPVAKLSRGQSIVLPSPAEIEAFRQRDSVHGKREKITGALELPTRTCTGCKRATFASAVLCPGCGRQFEDTSSATTRGANTRTRTVVQAPPAVPAAAPSRAAAEPSTKILTGQSTPSPAPVDLTLLKQFSSSARLMTAGTIRELDSGYKLHLEVLEGNAWKSLVIYEIFPGVCLRHEVGSDNQRKTIRIDLPPQAAIELANNDLETNWKSYEAAFYRA